MDDLNWDDLKFVLAVAEAGTFAAAGRQLKVSHTTVSRRIATFETRHGVRIFDPNPDRMSVTTAGANLVAHAKRVEAEMQQASRTLFGQDDRIEGKIRVSIVGALADLFVPIWHDFQEKYPSVVLDISANTKYANLSTREADVALRTTNAPSPHLVGRRLTTLRYAPFAAQSLVDRHGTELESLPWLGWDESVNAKLTAAWMAEHLPNVRITATTDNPSMFMKLLHHGFGAGFAVRGFTDGLVQLGPVIAEFDYDLWMLTHPDVRSSARIVAFTSFISSYFGEGF